MANYKNYAENLIGNWEKNIYEPQKDITKAIYQTNWNKLSNDYADVRDKLARNFELARNEYSNILNNIQDESFNRMNNANTDLANRGLSSSGVLDLVTQRDTQLKGEDVDEALSNLLNTNNASLEGLRKGVTNLGEGQTSLAEDLSKDIGKLTDADAANMQQYAALVGGIGESAARRAASRAGSGTSKKAKKLKEEADEIGRRIRIYDVLTSEDLTDQEKRNYLVIDLNVPSKTAAEVVSAYNNNKLLDQRDKVYETLTNNVNENGLNKELYDLNNIKLMHDRLKTMSNADIGNLIENDKKGMTPVDYTDYLILQNLKEGTLGKKPFKTMRAQNNVNVINNLNDKLGNYTYTDLARLLYGDK